MRSNMTPAFPEVILGRILEALEAELVAATDAEVLEAAQDLGMNPSMKGSAAFLGLKYPYRPQAQDFFDVLTAKDARLAVELVAKELVARRRAKAACAAEKPAPSRARLPRVPRPRRDK